MDMLKKFFPLSWKFCKDMKDLIIGVIIYTYGIIAASVILSITVIGVLLIPLVAMYAVVGVVLQILIFAQIIKYDEPANADIAEKANDESAKD